MSDDLNRLAGEAAEIDAELQVDAAAVEGMAVSQTVIDPVKEARDLIGFVVAVFVPLYPSLAKVYTDPAQDRLAAAAGPVMQKYGLSMSGVFSQWGPEIGLALVAVPLALETRKAIIADNVAAMDKAIEAISAGQGAGGDEQK